MVDEEKLKELREAQAKLAKIHKLKIKAKNRIIGLQIDGKGGPDEGRRIAYEVYSDFANAESEQRHIVYVLEKELFGNPKKPKKGGNGNGNDR